MAWGFGSSGSLGEEHWIWDWLLLQRAATEQLRRWWEISLQSCWNWKEKEVSGTGRRWSGCLLLLGWSMTVLESERAFGLHTEVQTASHTLGTQASSEGAGKVYRVPLPSSR